MNCDLYNKQRGAGGLALAALAMLACNLMACRPADRTIGQLRPLQYSARVINPQLARAMISPRDQALLLWGSDGTVLRSPEGASFEHAQVPTTSDLVDIAADEAGLLLAVGKQGVILQSRDGARSWSKVAESETADLKSAIYHAASRAWLVAGSNGTLLRSADEGRTWSRIETRSGMGFEKLFIDPRQQTLLVGG